MDSPRRLLKDALRLGILPKKALGQHFLVDPKAVQRIIEGAEIGPEDVVLEVGPGIGSLTFALLGRAKKVIAVELDERLCGFLSERAKGLPLELINADILALDLQGLLAPYGKVKALGNLPYNVATEILFKLLDSACFSSLTLMFQWEVALRICARPGTKAYGALTIMAGLYATAELLFRVPRGAFWPPPEVHGGVVRFRPYESPRGEPQRMRRFLEGVFSSRRKTLLNALARICPLGKEELREVLLRLGIEPSRRPETLTVEEYLALEEALRVELGRVGGYATSGR